MKRDFNSETLLQAWNLLGEECLTNDELIREKFTEEKGGDILYSHTLGIYIVRDGNYGNGFTDFNNVEVFPTLAAAEKYFNSRF